MSLRNKLLAAVERSSCAVAPYRERNTATTPENPATPGATGAQLKAISPSKSTATAPATVPQYPVAPPCNSTMSQAQHQQQLRNCLMTREQADQCHAGGWDDQEIQTFQQRVDRLVKWGRPRDEAEQVAERLTLRDRELDDRCLCLECVHLSKAGKCFQAVRGLVPGAGSTLYPQQTVLMRCEAFEAFGPEKSRR